MSDFNMNSFHVTINDVAKEAQVSRATVYRVINNKGYVSEKAREAVLTAIEKLHFKPNKIAQTLASNKKYVIGVIFPTVEKDFWDEVEAGIDSAAREYETSGISVIKFPIKLFDVDEQREALEKAFNAGIDGLALATAHASKLNDCIKKFIDKNIPVVTFNSDAPKSGRVCFVGQDLVKSGALAADLMALHLGNKGDVAIFRALRELLAIQQRVLGFTERIEVDYPGINIIGCYDFDESEEKAYSLTKEVIMQNPDLKGIFVTNAYINVVGRSLKDMNLDREICLVGYDLTQETKSYIKEGIINAVINQEPFVQGFKPIQILHDIIIDKKMPDREIINTKHEIILPGNV